MRQEVFELLNNIEELVAQLKKQLNGPSIDEIEVVVIADDEIFYGHIWDGEKNSHPQVIALRSGTEREESIQSTVNVFNFLTRNRSAIKPTKTIKWISDIKWSELPELIREFKKIMNIVEFDVSEELREQIKKEHR